MNVQQVWQAQATEAPRISLAYVRHRAGSVERRTRLRNALEYGGESSHWSSLDTPRTSIP